MRSAPDQAPDRPPGAGARPPLARVLVTRPAPEAQSWSEQLNSQGWPAMALPLIELVDPDSPADQRALQHWRQAWPAMDAVFFVSGAAVQNFFAGFRPEAVPASCSTRFWAPGPGTARALALALAPLAGAASRIDSPGREAQQFDSEALWAVVAPQVQPGWRVLVVRGASAAASGAGAVDAETPGGLAGQGRDWLLQQCRLRGAEVESCVAYERRAPVWSAGQRAVAAASLGHASHGEADRCLWLFSSSEALAYLRLCMPAFDASGATALATHPRIAAAVRQAGWGRVLETRPALADVLRVLESNWSRP